MRILGDVSRQDAGEEGACDTIKESLLARQKDQRRSETELDDTQFERPNGRVGLIICRSATTAMLAPGVVLATSRNELANPSGETLITMGDRVDHSGFGQGKKVSMRQTKPQTVYVSPQQVQRQREHKDKN